MPGAREPSWWGLSYPEAGEGQPLGERNCACWVNKYSLQDTEQPGFGSLSGPRPYIHAGVGRPTAKPAGGGRFWRAFPSERIQGPAQEKHWEDTPISSKCHLFIIVTLMGSVSEWHSPAVSELRDALTKASPNEGLYNRHPS